MHSFICYRCGDGDKVVGVPPEGYDVCLRCWNDFYYLPFASVRQPSEPEDVRKWVDGEYHDILRYVVARQIRRIVT